MSYLIYLIMQFILVTKENARSVYDSCDICSIIIVCVHLLMFE